ncbi:MAG: flagellar M-ring protein FliF [Gemmatimonadetes bacterium]|nr:flagellar M-ring protein FliF [Gemmatimonadota bacterium]
MNTLWSNFADRVGGGRRALLMAVGVGLAAVIFLASRVASAPTWVPAVANVPLEHASTLTERLSAAGIAYQFARGGTEIDVAETDLARARVTLAKDGLPGTGRPGLELFDRPTWGWNEFTERVNYRRALEGELERTIGRMTGIERAEVHLGLPEDVSYRRAIARPMTASVLIAVQSGASPSPDVVRGIANLVSSSVDGLGADRVSIHDETGREWSERADSSSAGLSSAQLRAQLEVERTLEQKVTSLLQGVVGAGNSRVTVSAPLNFDRLERTTQSVDPDRQAIATEQKSESTPGEEGGASSSSVSHTYENTRSTETYAGSVGTVRRLSVAVLVNERREPATGASDTVPRFTSRSAAEMARIDTLVRATVGADAARGDQVTVVSLRFDSPRIAVATPAPVPALERVRPFIQPVLTALGLLLAFALMYRTLGVVRASASSGPRTLPAASASSAAAIEAPAAAAAVAGGASAASLAAAAAPKSNAPRFAFREADTEIRDKVVSTVVEHPEAAARLVKAWLKES